MTECLKNAASDAVTRRTGTVKAVIETVFRRHELPCTVRVTEEGGVVDRFGLRPHLKLLKHWRRNWPGNWALQPCG